MPEPAISKYDRDTQRFDCIGLDLNRPIDSITPGYFPILQNVRSYQGGRVGPRPGLVSQGLVANGSCHSLKRLNDPKSNDYIYVAGVGIVIAYGKPGAWNAPTYATGALTFSGNPLALVPSQPAESPQSWLFIGDSNPNVTSPSTGVYANTLKKISLPNSGSGVINQIGMPAPILPPNAVLSAPSYKYTDPDFDMEFADNTALQTAWVADGVIAAAPTLVTRVNTTIIAIKYDAASPNWACVQPAAMTNIGIGSILVLSGGVAEKIVVEEVHAVSATTTISSIIYDVGTSGNCSLVLSDPIQNVDENSLLNNSTASEYSRVLNVTTGLNGSVSIRISTSATYAAGDTIKFVGSFRAYFTSNHAATENVTAKAASSTIATGTGLITRTASYDFSTISSFVAATLDDYIHLSLLADNPSLITEIKFLFDCDIATNNFTKNYFYLSISPDTLNASAQNLQTLQTALQTAVTNALIFDAGASTSTSDNLTNTEDIITTQLDLGVSQWSELRNRQSAFIRVGTDMSRGWANIAAVGIQVTCTGSVNVGFDDIQLGGGFGPDQTNTAVPYVYRYRARCIETGAKSNPSPPTRGITIAGQAIGGGVTPYRESVTVSIDFYNLATEADALDIERYGGDLTAWHYVGTINNLGGTNIFIDTYADSTVAAEPEEDIVNQQIGYGLDSYQPWPIRALPIFGEASLAAGTTIRSANHDINLRLSLGTTVILGGTTSVTVYRVIDDQTFEVFEGVGTLANVTMFIEAPIITSQPLPCLWGPLDTTLFACGDTLNPGRLYYTGVNSEGCADSDFYDVTSASEPLMNGCLYNGRSYVWSSERFFQIIPQGPNSPIRYTVQEIPGGKGLFSRWALAVGPLMYTLYQSGIYASDGSPQQSITDDKLYPLFPTESILGQSVGPIGAPNIDISQSTSLRLNYAVDFLYFDYVDINSNKCTLAFNGKGWFYDTYGVGINFHYEDEGVSVRAIFLGGADGNLYQYSSFTSDAGNLITFEIDTPARDQGDDRALKLFGDLILDCNTSGVDVTCLPYINNYNTALDPSIVNNSVRDTVPINLHATKWQIARNISLKITFSINTPIAQTNTFFYIWEPRWTFSSAPVSAYSWEISPSTLGFYNFKSLGFGRFGYVSNDALSILVTLDGVAQTPITLSSSSGKYVEYVFRYPVYKAKQYGMRVSCITPFRLSTGNTYIEVKEWASNDAYRQLKVYSDFSYIQG